MNKEYIRALHQHITDHPPTFCDAESVLGALYETYSASNRMDGEEN